MKALFSMVSEYFIQGIMGEYRFGFKHRVSTVSPKVTSEFRGFIQSPSIKG